MERQYIGKRYVPKIMGEWDINTSYESLSIVVNNGDSYTSKKDVPIGIELTDIQYWVRTAIFNAQLESYRNEVKEMEEQLEYRTIKSVKEFGAKGDGITDDTLSLQTAFDYGILNNAKIVIPMGTYRVTNSLYIKDSLKVSGEKGVLNGKATYIQLDSLVDIPTLVVENPNAEFNNGFIHNVFIDNIALYKKDMQTNVGHTNNKGVGLLLKKASECKFDNISCSGFKIGLELRETSISDFVKPTMYYNKYGVWLGNYDLNGNNMGTNGMNNFYFGNLYRNITDIVLGGELNNFIGCHMENATKESFLIDNLYTKQLSHITIRNCNIRHYTDNTRILRINGSVSTEPLYIFQFQIENTFCKQINSLCAIEQVNNGSANRSTRLFISNSSFWGVSESVVSSEYPLTIEFNGLIRCRSGANGDGTDLPFYSSAVKPLGSVIDFNRNNILGTTKLGNNTTGIVNSEGEIWFDNNDKNIKLHDGYRVKTLRKNGSGLLKLGSNQLITNNVTATLSWGLKPFDTDGFWSNSTPTKLIIPNGVKKVKITSCIMWDVNGTGIRTLDIIKNGASFDGRSTDTISAIASVNIYNHISTPPIEVNTGDYFEIRASHNCGSDLNVISGERTWVSIEVIE